MLGTSTTRAAVRSVWENRLPDFGSVTDNNSAGRVLSELLSSTLDILEYRKLAFEPDAIQLVSSDRQSYLRFEAADDRIADVAVHLSHVLSAHAADANFVTALTGEQPPWRTSRILVLANSDGTTVKRLDLDPMGNGGVSWHGAFDHEQFTEVATGLTLLLTHLVAHVFDDDDGSETFEESFDWVF